MGTVAIQLKGAHIDTLRGIRDTGYGPPTEQLCVCVSISICQGPGLTSSAPSLTSHTEMSFVPRLWFMIRPWRGAQHQCVITWKCVSVCVPAFTLHKTNRRPIISHYHYGCWIVCFQTYTAFYREQSRIIQVGQLNKQVDIQWRTNILHHSYVVYTCNGVCYACCKKQTRWW